MKKLLFAFLAGIFCILGVLSVSAADITVAENGQPIYKIGADSTWLSVDENEAAFADFVKIIEDYSGVDFEEFDPLVQISDKEIIVGYTKEAGRHKTRIKDGNIYAVTEDLIGARGWAIFTYGDKIVISVPDRGSSAEAHAAMIYFLENALGFDYNNPEYPATGSLVLPEINYVKSEFLDTDRSVKITVNGKNVNDYTIVYPANASETVVKAAEEMRRIIFAFTARPITVTSDATAVEGPVIKIGFTDKTTIKNDGDNFVIGGKNDVELISAIEYFYAEYLDIEGRKYVGDGSEIALEGIDFNADTVFYINGELNDAMKYYRHNIADLLGSYDAVCYSDSAVVDKLISGLEAGEPAEGSTVYLINNTNKHCSCSSCADKSDPFFTAVNTVAKHFAAKNITVATLATKTTAKAPEFALESNVLVYFAAPEMCCAHSIDDVSCEQNKAIAENLKSWNGKAKVFVLDYTQDYSHYPSTFPNFSIIEKNISFYRANANGAVFVWNKNQANFEFGELRLTLINHALAVELTSDAYSAYMTEVLTDIYGDSADEIAQYIEVFAAASAEHFDIGTTPAEMLPVTKNDDGSYDLAKAKEMYAIWKSIYYRHEAPTEDLTGLAEAYFAYNYTSASYCDVLHARIQFFTWLKHNVPTLEKFDVFSELIK